MCRSCMHDRMMLEKMRIGYEKSEKEILVRTGNKAFLSRKCADNFPRNMYEICKCLQKSHTFFCEISCTVLIISDRCER